ncbi:hypothetical protein EDB89DRAFT_2047264 [Lactarius sanguifluus]|nr:hypothetical protein EDB89DRAFT_2047264 [Lactarius sanguifluus]
MSTYQIYRSSRKGLRPNCCLSSHHPQFVRAGETIRCLGQAFQGGGCLTLLNVVHSRFPADEARYHSVATPYCESRSVIGTMQAVADMDGWDRAQRFSTSMFPPQRIRRHLFEKSAEALRDAVWLGRKKRVGVVRWVNVVHYGARSMDGYRCLCEWPNIMRALFGGSSRAYHSHLNTRREDLWRVPVGRLTPQKLGFNSAHPSRVDGRTPEDLRELGIYWRNRIWKDLVDVMG